MQGVLKASQHRFPSAAPCLWGPGPLATSRGLAACGTPAAAPRSCQRFAGSHEEAECRGEEGLRAKHLSPTPAVLCSSTCLVLAHPPRSSLLLSIPLPTLPASAPKLCGCSWFTFSLSQPSGLSVPGSSLPGMLSLEPRRVAKSWPHLSPPRPTCKGRSVLLVPPSP